MSTRHSDRIGHLEEPAETGSFRKRPNNKKGRLRGVAAVTAVALELERVTSGFHWSVELAHPRLGVGDESWHSSQGTVGHSISKELAIFSKSNSS